MPLPRRKTDPAKREKAKAPKTPTSPGPNDTVLSIGGRSDWACAMLEDSYSLGYKVAGGSLTRQPGQISPLDADGEPVTKADTREYMHPCVWYRRDRLGSKYVCPSLDSTYSGGWISAKKEETRWEHQGGERGEGFKWVRLDKDGNVLATIPQYIIHAYEDDDGIGSLERLLVPAPYQRKLDIANDGVKGCGLKIVAETTDDY